MDETSLTLLQQLRGESAEAAWHRLVTLYEPFIRRQLAASGLDAADAEDLTQEVLTTLFKNVGQFERRRSGSFRNWLRTITHNAAVSWLRAGRGKPAGGDFAGYLTGLADPKSDPSRRWDTDHRQFVARKIVELIEPQFTPHVWRMFKLHVLDGQTSSAAGAACGATANAVLLAKARVLRRMRRQMDELDGPESADGG